MRETKPTARHFSGGKRQELLGAVGQEDEAGNDAKGAEGVRRPSGERVIVLHGWSFRVMTKPI